MFGINGGKNMKKFTGIVLSLTLCMGLAACGAEDSTGQAQTPSTQAVQEAAGVSDKAVNTEAVEDETDQTGTEVAAEAESDWVYSDNTVVYVRTVDDYNVYYIIDLGNRITRYGSDLGPTVEEGILTEGDNLNDGISVNYNMGADDEYSESLYLKNADDDSTLILAASDGEEYEFSKTDISSVPYYLQ